MLFWCVVFRCCYCCREFIAKKENRFVCFVTKHKISVSHNNCMHFDAGKSFEGIGNEGNEVEGGVETEDDNQVDTEVDTHVETVVGRSLRKGRIGIGFEGIDANINQTVFRLVGPFFPLVAENLPPLSPPPHRDPSSCFVSLHFFRQSVPAASLDSLVFPKDVVGFAAFWPFLRTVFLIAT